MSSFARLRVLPRYLVGRAARWLRSWRRAGDIRAGPAAARRRRWPWLQSAPLRPCRCRRIRAPLDAHIICACACDDTPVISRGSACQARTGIPADRLHYERPRRCRDLAPRRPGRGLRARTDYGAFYSSCWLCCALARADFRADMLCAGAGFARWCTVAGCRVADAPCPDIRGRHATGRSQTHSRTVVRPV